MTAAEHHSYSDLLREVQPRPIQTKADYRRQLEWLEHLMGFPPARDTSMMIELLSLTLGAYEAQHFPIADAAPEEVLDHLIENSGQTSSAIARAIGISPSTLSNYRTGRRKLTIDSIRQLAQYFRVGAAVFLGKHSPSARRMDRQVHQDRHDAIDQRVLDAVEQLGGDGVSAADIRQHLGLTPQQLGASLNRLIERGRVTSKGSARATRYSIA